MSTAEQKKIAYDLTLEYVRENLLLKGDVKDIPNQLKQIEKIYSIMCEELNHIRIDLY